MFRYKIIFSIFIFSFLLVGTSYIKNETREIEKKIFVTSKKINTQEKNLNLSSPSILEKKIEYLLNNEYFPMEQSRIFLNILSFTNLENKLVKKK